MNNLKKISTKLSNGTIVEYNVVLTFLNENNHKNYLIYTDNTLDQSNKLRFYAAIYNSNLSNPYLGEPTTKEEWNYINNILNQVIL
jgi:uncharacterized protein YrzB (UPF0473 family)